MVEGLVNHFGWQVEGREGTVATGHPREGTQPLIATLDSERAPGPADHQPKWPISQVTKQLTH